MPGWSGYEYFPPSVPRKAKGGIKARSRRGAFATTWWGQRWLSVLESFDLGARLGRGRSYARKGQVTGLEIGAGTVRAKVQGSRVRPYSVSIAIKPVAAAKWRKLAKAVAEDMAMAARLLAGEMPPEIEGTFAATGAALFPDKVRDLKTECSCPDWSNPCKHIAAVYYLLAEEFDRDPFLLLRLRGTGRDQFVALLGIGSRARTGEDEGRAANEQAAPEPLSSDPETFWSGGGPKDPLATVTVPPPPAALAAGLGGFPFWRGEEDFEAVVSEACERAAANGLRAFLGSTDAGDADTDESRPRRTPVPASRSIVAGELVCRECGRKLRRLKRHIESAHGLTPAAYRKKWRLAADTPLVAPSDPSRGLGPRRKAGPSPRTGRARQ
jgi:uncharacterized Zn finger protein